MLEAQRLCSQDKLLKYYIVVTLLDIDIRDTIPGKENHSMASYMLDSLAAVDAGMLFLTLFRTFYWIVFLFRAFTLVMSLGHSAVSSSYSGPFPG